MSVATPMHFRVNVNLQTIKTFHIFSVLMTCVVFRIVCVHFKVNRKHNCTFSDKINKPLCISLLLIGLLAQETKGLFWETVFEEWPDI